MDFGIEGRGAIVCAASRGLGRACAMALAEEGVRLVINARTAADLEQTATDIRDATGAEVTAIAGDITTEDGRDAVLAAMAEPDILVTNAGGPPPGDFHDWDRDIWIAALNANMLTPIELITATIDGMLARKFGRIINITSNMVKAPLDILGLSNGARSGLTGFVAGLARRKGSENVTINNMLPGNMNTQRLQSNFVAMAKKADMELDDYIAMRLGSIPAGRLGDPEEFGALCAYLCSNQAAYITGQNFLIDGGTNPGVF